MTRTILVTGASKGIGRAVAVRLAKDGFDVAVHFGSDENGARDTLGQISAEGGKGWLLSFDIADREACAAALEADMREHGCYYGAVLNAGIARDNAFPAMPGADWDAVLRTNLDGFYNVLNPVVMPMVSARKGGRIVTLSSVSGMIGNRGQVNYSAAKAGIIGASKALALELAKRRITVDCVAPGFDRNPNDGIRAEGHRAGICAYAPDRPARRSRRRRFVPMFGRRQLYHASGDRGERRHGLTRRVVITGAGGITCLGDDWPTIRARMMRGESGVRTMAEWDRYPDINTRLAAPIVDFSIQGRYPRKSTRTMGPVSLMAVYATERALASAGLLEAPVLKNGRCGIAYGSSFGSTAPLAAFAELKVAGATKKLGATSYLQMMSHTAAVNIGLFFGITGRIVATSTACTSGSQGIGYAYESILAGRADVMLAGGADELDIGSTAVFDLLYATSTCNDRPNTSPRPFDRDRDGLVIGEGAATLVLEERDHALSRGAAILAEVVGFACNSDGCHATQPQARTMELALRGSLADARLDAGAIGFVSGHGTATEGGDIAECEATHAVLGSRTPIHSLKSYFGHSLGACGAIEAWLGIEMMREGLFLPTLNLDNVDERCAPLDHVMGKTRALDVEYLMSNNFAFGGINTSLIFQRV